MISWDSPKPCQIPQTPQNGTPNHQNLLKPPNPPKRQPKPPHKQSEPASPAGACTIPNVTGGEFLGGFWAFLGRFFFELPYFSHKSSDLAQIWFWSTSNFIIFYRSTNRATSVAKGPQARELFCVQTLWDSLYIAQNFTHLSYLEKCMVY